MKYLVLGFFLLVSSHTHGRVFSFESENLATYLRGTAGLSAVDNTAFAASSGSGTSFTDQVKYNFSGELGFIFTHSGVSLRLGVEGLIPKEVEAASGTNSGGTELLTVTSENLGVIPIANLEVAFYELGSTRLSAGGGVGYVTLSSKNTYTITTDGQSALGVTDYVEEVSGSTIGGQIFGMLESHFTDNVTVTAEVGYRYYKVSELTHDTDVTTINGTFAKGATAVNNDGTKREIDLSGLFVGLGFRIYIDIY